MNVRFLNSDGLFRSINDALNNVINQKLVGKIKFNHISY